MVMKIDDQKVLDSICYGIKDQRMTVQYASMDPGTPKFSPVFAVRCDVALLIALSRKVGNFVSDTQLLDDFNRIHFDDRVSKQGRWPLKDKSVWALRVNRTLRDAGVPAFVERPHERSSMAGRFRLITMSPPANLPNRVVADGVNLKFQYKRSTSVGKYGYLLLCSLLNTKESITWEQLDHDVYRRVTSPGERYTIYRECERVLRSIELPGQLAYGRQGIRIAWDAVGVRPKSSNSNSLYREIEGSIPTNIRTPTRRALRLVLDADGLSVSLDEMRRFAWAESVSEENIRATIKRASGLVSSQLQSMNCFVRVLPNRFCVVKTETLKVDNVTNCDGKTLHLEGPAGMDDEPRTLEQFLTLRELQKANGRHISKARLFAALHYAGKGGYHRLLDDNLQVLDQRLAAVGSPSRIVSYGRSVQLLHTVMENAMTDSPSDTVKGLSTGL